MFVNTMRLIISINHVPFCIGSKIKNDSAPQSLHVYLASLTPRMPWVSCGLLPILFNLFDPQFSQE